MFFDSDIAGPKTSPPTSTGVKVVVDPSSAQMLTGATLDYKDGLNQAGFSIDNPNAQRTCGCGSSFS
jgi:iron-sulfur cluster assembly accessory protein